ncbi:hypothetical protein BDV96DRAFT_599081 [Lophiotrema nucula]|uniref:Uncharacterized protein n=1 Tax=Lophiotrema nucula TaxID=690887 RepID=A0A6A5ZBQ5_9PLEO|nr:hypothetical protein BDV96DRAFT_599081 [Lophiotrema nucula]
MAKEMQFLGPRPSMGHGTAFSMSVLASPARPPLASAPSQLQSSPSGHRHQLIKMGNATSTESSTTSSATTTSTSNPTDLHLFVTHVPATPTTLVSHVVPYFTASATATSTFTPDPEIEALISSVMANHPTSLAKRDDAPPQSLGLNFPTLASFEVVTLGLSSNPSPSSTTPVSTPSTTVTASEVGTPETTIDSDYVIYSNAERPYHGPSTMVAGIIGVGVTAIVVASILAWWLLCGKERMEKRKARKRSAGRVAEEGGEK